MHVAEYGEGPLVLMCHGWPELWYSWRHQLVALAAAGFRAVAPDMRGFGRTSAPDDVAAYTILHNVGDMVALVDGARRETRADRRARLGRAGRLACGADAARCFSRRRRDERAASPARLAAAARHAAQGRQGRLLLSVFPGAGGRGRVRARSALHAPPHPLHRLGRDAARPEDEHVCGPGEGISRRVARAGPAATVADRSRHRCVRRRIQAQRLSRRAQLVSQHRPQLGADRAVARRENHAAGAVHRRHQRCGHHRLDGTARARRDGQRRAEPAAQVP